MYHLFDFLRVTLTLIKNPEPNKITRLNTLVLVIFGFLSGKK